MDKQGIIKLIREYVINSEYETMWEEPLIGFANSNNKLFSTYKEMIDDNYLLPKDILPEAKTVVSYFLPFTKEMVKTNYGGDIPSRDWAVAYVETNQLLGELADYLILSLKKEGIKADKAMFQAPGFDTEKIISYWSQRHVAYAAGLGTFGINNMLITDKGCCGRFGSIVIDKEIESNSVLTTERCIYKNNGSCKKCIEACPSKALTDEGFDRHKCYELVQKYDKMFPDLGESEVCGKCLAYVPCSFTNPLIQNSCINHCNKK